MLIRGLHNPIDSGNQSARTGSIIHHEARERSTVVAVPPCRHCARYRAWRQCSGVASVVVLRTVRPTHVVRVAGRINGLVGPATIHDARSPCVIAPCIARRHRRPAWPPTRTRRCARVCSEEFAWRSNDSIVQQVHLSRQRQSLNSVAVHRGPLTAPSRRYAVRTSRSTPTRPRSGVLENAAADGEAHASRCRLLCRWPFAPSEPSAAAWTRPKEATRISPMPASSGRAQPPSC